MKSYHSIRCIGAIAGSLFGLIAALDADSAILLVPADYPNIQAAVDEARSGDTIHIAAGVYQEQVVIGEKTLTLTGEPGTIIQAWTGMVKSPRLPFTWKALFEITSGDVTLRGLDLEGERLSDDLLQDFFNDVFAGVIFHSSSGRVEDCVFRGFRGTNTFTGWGIFSLSTTSPGSKVVNLQIIHNTFADTGLAIDIAGVIGFEHPDQVPLSIIISIDGNVITGNGPSALDYQRGMIIRNGVAGTIKNNRISDMYYLGTDTTANGILAFDVQRFPTDISALQPLRFEGNTFVNNQVGLVTARCDNCIYVDNIFQGSGSTSDGLGIGLGISGTNLTANFNQFSNLNYGIALAGDDPVYGTALGIAKDSVLTDNRFCSVGTNVVIEPLVTNTREVGSLTCPFPTPTVGIAPAVLLSWPNYASDSTLESATDLDGVWSLVDATPTVQNGRYLVTVQSDGQRHFYRLRVP